MLKRSLVAALVLLLAACGGSGRHAKTPKPLPSLTGAGATFPAPLYAQWAAAFQAAGGQPVNYQPIGSGGGIKQIHAGTVDFGASDRPLSAAELQSGDLVQFPTVLGGVVPVINLPGVKSGELRLTGVQLADIYRGAITRWSDPRLASARAALPDLPVTVVHRSDGSGTTFLFTSYLSLKSPAWKQAFGVGEGIEWPGGVGGKGNDGVAAYVRQTPGAIGYVEHAFASHNGMTSVLLQNAGGQFIDPTPASFAAAATGADWAAAPGFNLLLLDEPGSGSWPITAATFILVHKTQQPERAAQAIKFVDWAYAKGDASASGLGYTPLPAPVKALVRAAWAKDLPAR